MEKNRVLNQSINYSVTHSVSLFDAPGTEAFASEEHEQDRTKWGAIYFHLLVHIWSCHN